jgi:hypothetical protein
MHCGPLSGGGAEPIRHSANHAAKNLENARKTARCHSFARPVSVRPEHKS